MDKEKAKEESVAKHLASFIVTPLHGGKDFAEGFDAGYAAALSASSGTPADDPAPVNKSRRELANMAWDFLNEKRGQPKNELQITAQDSICGDMADFSAQVTADLIRERDEAIDKVRELEAYKEMLRVATCVQFGPNGTLITRLGSKPYEYGLMIEGEAERGDYTSFLEAFAALEENKV